MFKADSVQPNNRHEKFADVSLQHSPEIDPGPDNAFSSTSNLRWA